MENQTLFKLQNDPEFVKYARVLAPTGCAACGIAGCTCHSGLTLPVGEARAYILRGDAKHRLEKRWSKDVKLVLIDERGMVGQSMLAWIDIRLRNFSSV